MAKAEFSLKERDNLRYFKDRMARFVVKSGGIAILGAILLIFFYLVSMVIPIFSGASIVPAAQYELTVEDKLLALGGGDYGENVFAFDDQGQLIYLGVESEKITRLLTTKVAENPSVLVQSARSQGWYTYGTFSGEIIAVKPSFSVSFSEQGRVFTPNLQSFNSGYPIKIDSKNNAITKLAFAIEDEVGTFVALSVTGEINAIEVRSTSRLQESLSERSEFRLSLPEIPTAIDEIALSPDGGQLFILSGSDLAVVDKKGTEFILREWVDLSRGDLDKTVADIHLMSGAHSILVEHRDNTVSQWFDVLKSGERALSKIREFSSGKSSGVILTDTYKKGFFRFSSDGDVEYFYTTSEKDVLAQTLFKQAPDLVSLSDNNEYLMSLQGSEFTIQKVNYGHPAVSFKSLWNKVWYENYPEPQFVWQTTAANDDFEAKFSLVPIAFGTLKATIFAMLFSVPIAVAGAIYTAYFMSSPMRRLVKPSIEIMEALPTVIIGFLAGLWLAPIVETYLTGVVILLIMIPLASVLMGGIWGALPKRLLAKVSSGLHVIILIPVILLVVYLSLIFSADIESWWFDGDIRVFLAEHGISYDQRNALVVGIAMGFAVIPTIFTIAEDAIFSVPKHLSDGSLALGATQWQTLIYVVLLTASPGIFSAIMIGLGRAVGETMIVLMATGNTPIMEANIFEGLRSLSATIAVEMPESEVGDTHYRILFLAALVLFVFTFAVNSVAEIVRQRLKEKYSSM